jgi:hypothetical protein
MKTILCSTGIEAKSGEEQNGIYQHEAYLWLKESLEPSPLMIVPGMRIWNAYKAKHGTKKLSRRALYVVIRKVLEEEAFQKHQASFQRGGRGMVVTNTKANSHLEAIKNEL